MTKRQIVQIDKDRCDGCGACVNACAEGAIQIVNGKAQLINEIYCDGLGACLGSCPKGAITIVEKETIPFDEEATKKHLELIKIKEVPSCECLSFMKNHKLNNWPIQLKLISVNASFLKNAHLLIAADCTAFSYNNFHKEILKDKKLIIACPKLDDAKFYIEKLTEIFNLNNIKAITVLRMTVPCCAGLTWIIKEALNKSGKNISFEEKIIDIDGTMKSY
ncbi:ATP-binding protein [Thermodesulfovibrio yellowstonii]|uniref:Ferredoxin n=1 Tax=Thermodesulfovibrio yellowstonii TaxID=28262 RepID=A0A9W6GEX3_9BACT|nr:4Fe-4S binding protein [Thermodesulfovibrio islandicus]GLI52740.1 ferredoxin [Thermodesulfovibrio islandicus]